MKFYKLFVNNSLVHNIRNKLLFRVSKTISCPVTDVAATTSSVMITSRRFISNRCQNQNCFNFPKISSTNGIPGIQSSNTFRHTDRKVFHQMESMLCEMGFFIQIQNDFLDCFGDPNIIGKIGTDIQDGKCTWLSVVCMELANEEEKNIMRQNYGRNEPEDIASIKQLYVKLGLPKAFAEYEETFKLSVQLDKIGKTYYDFFDHFRFDTFH